LLPALIAIYFGVHFFRTVYMQSFHWHIPVWSSLPLSLWLTDSYTELCRHLKTICQNWPFTVNILQLQNAALFFYYIHLMGEHDEAG